MCTKWCPLDASMFVHKPMGKLKILYIFCTSICISAFVFYSDETQNFQNIRKSKNHQISQNIQKNIQGLHSYSTRTHTMSVPVPVPCPHPRPRRARTGRTYVRPYTHLSKIHARCICMHKESSIACIATRVRTTRDPGSSLRSRRFLPKMEEGALLYKFCARVSRVRAWCL